MNNEGLLMVAMAEQCRTLILECGMPNTSLPQTLQPRHLLWMCDQIEQHAERGPTTRLHRWIGFVQSAMLAHRMLDLEGAKAMFNKAKSAHGDPGEDLLDHLDSTNPYRVDLGGEG